MTDADVEVVLEEGYEEEGMVDGMVDVVLLLINSASVTLK